MSEQLQPSGHSSERASGRSAAGAHDKRAPPRLAVTARLIWSSPVHWLAFGFGSGLAPVAPGTFGTLAALPLWWVLSALSLPAFAVACLLMFGLGCWVCGLSARRLGVHDYGGIVFDEVVGFLIAALPLLPAGRRHSALGLLLAFVLFRIFDILKPWPIRACDRRVGGGLGIMLDDVLAGLGAAAVLWVLLRSLPGLAG